MILDLRKTVTFRSHAKIPISIKICIGIKTFYIKDGQKMLDELLCRILIASQENQRYTFGHKPYHKVL